MRFHPKNLFAFLLLFFVTVVNAQIIEGRIIDKDLETPLDGATVYIDGTTQMTITNPDGTFKINAGNGNTTLIVSYIGYTSYRIENPLQFQNKKLKIYLERESTALEEVVIGKSPFSRKEMLAVFKNHFLGNSRSAHSCTIKNEDDIILRFDVSNNTLNASSRQPLRIKNNYLEYEVNFDLIEFTANFSKKSLMPYHLQRSYFAGSTFYKDLSKKGKADKKRIQWFMGSAPHLMLTIANEDWENQKFKLFVDSFQANPKDYFRISDTLGIKKIKIIRQPMRAVTKEEVKNQKIDEVLIKKEAGMMEKAYFNILYDKDFQSILDFSENEIIVDKDGNYSPIYGVLLGGFISSLKAGDMLPRDFYETVKSNPNN